MKYDIPRRINHLINESINEYGYDIEPDNEEIWEIAKNFKKFPYFENIYIDIFYKNLIEKLPEKYEYDYYINGFDSHLYYYDENEDCYEINYLRDMINCEN